MRGLSRIESVFAITILFLLVSIPVIRWINFDTQELMVTVPILERKYIKQDGRNLEMPVASKHGKKSTQVRVEIASHWLVTVRIDGEQRKIMIPLEERNLAQLPKLEVTYQYLRTGEFKLLDFAEPRQ